MAEQVISIDSKKTGARLAILAAVILALIFGWFGVRWQFGSMLAELTPANDPNAKAIADFAVWLSPSDPAARWFAARTETDIFTSEKIESSLLLHEKTVRLAPYDFRYWIQLGRAYEQAEKYDRAETVLRYALELAPNYTFPHWQLGNFYLRRGRDAEAFAELKKAAENNVVYREQVFSIAWDFYEKDTAKLEELAGNSAESRVTLAKFYAAKERPQDSLRIWETLSANEKQENQEIAKIITQALYDKGFYRSAASFVSQLGIESNAKVNSIENQGFEAEIRTEGQIYFGWRVTPTEKIEVKTDPNRKREGIRSLRVLFSGFSKAELNNISQVVPVQAEARFRLSFWVKTENLKSAGTPTIEIVNANDNRLIAVSKSFPNETNDWTQLQTDFTTPANTEGVFIRLGRAYCGDSCPIVGTIWLDDFNLEKLK